MIRATLPMPTQIVIDDVGWWSGEDGSKRGEPFRTGISRDHVPADYAAIASLGRQLGMRPQAVMVLCEWDRENTLRDVPSSTWMGEAWDNSRWVGPWLDEAAAIFHDNPDHIELTLHGIGHEYWTDCEMTRAEWHDRQGVMRPRDQVLLHLDYCQKLLRQNGFDEFPESFVPCAFLHAFADPETGFGGMLRDAGIKYISTPFSTMSRANQVQEALFGVDHGIVTVDRGHSGMPWYEFPSTPPAVLEGPILGMHWPNTLHEDPSRNEEAVAEWVAWLAEVGSAFDRILSPNTASCWTQLAYRTCTDLSVAGDAVALDFSRVDALGVDHLLAEFTLRVTASPTTCFESDTLKVCSSEWCDEGGYHTVQVARASAEPRALLRMSDST